MFRLNQYIAVQSLEQAYDLLMKNKNNTILGGMLWMKMGKKRYHTGIDLMGLGLNRIVDTGKTIEIGSMVTLREMETNPDLVSLYGSLFQCAFKHIVGVQFRNCATLGGSIYPRFGFSDVLTSLLLLDTKVVLFKAGAVTLEQFLVMAGKRDIVVKVIIDKQKWDTRYLCQRKSATDFPVLSLAVGRSEKKWRICAGARPARAKRAEKTAGLLYDTPDSQMVDQACESIIQELSFGTDSRGDASFRKILTQVFLKRGIQQICG